MQPEIVEKLQNINNLATIPQNAMQIIHIINNPDSSIKEISNLIERDAPLTTKILKIANSPFIGYPGQVVSLQRAITILGLNQIKNIVLAIALYSSFINFENSENFDREKFWLHSFGTGQIARHLCAAIGLHFVGEEFVGGVIHDVGKIILDQYFPREFKQIIEMSKKEKISLINAERKVLGADHAELGEWLLKHWQFPKALTEVVRYHHEPELATVAPELVSVIQISEVLCELWGIGFDGDMVSCILEDLQGWKILQSKHSRLKDVDLERMTLDLYKEIETAREFMEIAKS